MKDAEDEAFEEIERKQSGFQAKRAMAADKLWDKPSVAFDEWWNGDNDESTNPFRLEIGAYWAWAGWKAALAQPAQELDALTIAYQSGFYNGKKAAQRPWVGLTEEDFSTINQSCLTKLQAATSAESILKEKNS